MTQEELIAYIVDCGQTIEAMDYNTKFAAYGKDYEWSPQRAYYIRKQAAKAKQMLEDSGYNMDSLDSNEEYEYANQFL